MSTNIAQRTLSAYLSNEDSPDIINPIHSTVGGTKYGFSGALVGGVTVYGWAAESVLAVLGEEWLSNGWAEVAFKRPVYPGDALVIQLDDDGEPGYRLTVAGEDGAPKVSGRVGLGRAPWFDTLAAPVTLHPEVPEHVEHTPLTLDTVQIGKQLIPILLQATVAEAREYALSKQRSTDERFIGDAPLLHPALIAGFETRLAYGQFDFSPGIHVNSYLQHLARPEAGEGYVATGSFIDAFEKNGRHHGVVDGSLLRNSVEIVRGRQGFIFAIPGE